MREVNKVAVLFAMPEEKRKELEAIFPGAGYVYSDQKNVSGEEMEDVDVILGFYPPEKLKDLKKLKWVQLPSAGSDRYQKPGVFPEGVILTNASGCYGLGISECMLGMLFSIIKNLHYYRDNQNLGIWKDEGKVLPVFGSTALVIGLGDIGREFALRMKALGARVIGVTRASLIKPDYVDELYTTKDLDKILPMADIISLSVPETSETKNILSRERIGMLKETAIILNVGRGSAIDTEALADALESKKIRGAGLDVTDPEPLPQGHRLWKMRNALITPHVTGNHSLDETIRRIVVHMISNYRAYVNGEELKSIVDFKRGY